MFTTHAASHQKLKLPFESIHHSPIRFPFLMAQNACCVCCATPKITIALVVAALFLWGISAIIIFGTGIDRAKCKCNEKKCCKDNESHFLCGKDWKCICATDDLVITCELPHLAWNAKNIIGLIIGFLGAICFFIFLASCFCFGCFAKNERYRQQAYSFDPPEYQETPIRKM